MIGAWVEVGVATTTAFRAGRLEHLAVGQDRCRALELLRGGLQALRLRIGDAHDLDARQAREISHVIRSPLAEPDRHPCESSEWSPQVGRLTAARCICYRGFARNGGRLSAETAGSRYLPSDREMPRVGQRVRRKDLAQSRDSGGDACRTKRVDVVGVPGAADHDVQLVLGDRTGRIALARRLEPGELQVPDGSQEKFLGFRFCLLRSSRRHASRPGNSSPQP